MNPSLEPTSAGGPPKSHTVLHHVKPETPEVASSARMCSSCEAHVRLPTIRVTYLFISRESWRTATLATHVRHWLHSGFHLLLGRSASHCSSSHSKRSTVLTKIRFPASAAAAKMSGTEFSALAGCRQFLQCLGPYYAAVSDARPRTLKAHMCCVLLSTLRKP